MKISAKTNYALRTVLDLASHGRNGDVAKVGEIGARQDIPPKFLEQILLVLKGAGIVTSKRGVNGGYFLSMPPSRITLSSIIALTDEGLLSPRTPTREAQSEIPPGTVGALDEVWDRIGHFIHQTLEGTTIQDMYVRERELAVDTETHYAI